MIFYCLQSVTLKRKQNAGNFDRHNTVVVEAKGEQLASHTMTAAKQHSKRQLKKNQINR